MPQHTNLNKIQSFILLYMTLWWCSSHKHDMNTPILREDAETQAQHPPTVHLNTPPIVLRDKAKLEWIKLQSRSKVHQHPCRCNYFHNKQVERSFMEPQLIVSGQIPWEISQHALRLIIRKVEKKAADTQSCRMVWKQQEPQRPFQAPPPSTTTSIPKIVCREQRCALEHNPHSEAWGWEHHDIGYWGIKWHQRKHERRGVPGLY